ncbi:recombinase RecT [Paraburkholderia adhaesiva]|uniref:recombinase RecT n=1 Tax=Paraburkholderia adhaesiva TaxID=2883244 RepID=UPI001F204F31|nr:recombinase RecT [Paraburkholderia adhaesiva]
MPIPHHIQAFRADILSDRQIGQIALVLPPGMDPRAFARVAATAVLSTPDLYEIEQTSLLAACMEAAQDGLLPDGREGAIVPFTDTKHHVKRASWIPMVGGLLKLVRQSGELLDVAAYIVRTNDLFEYEVNEHGVHFRHRPDVLHPGAPPLLVYAFARMKEGGVYFESMPWSEIEHFRELTKAHAPDAPWQQWPDEMAKVRPLKRLAKRLPMSVAAHDALRRDDQRDARYLGQSPGPGTDDPVGTINAAIREATAAQSADPPPSADEAADAQPASGEEPATRNPPPGTDGDEAADAKPTLAFTYAQVAERLNRAKNRAALAAAAKLIDAVTDDAQREELRALAGEIGAELAAKAKGNPT